MNILIYIFAIGLAAASDVSVDAISAGSAASVAAPDSGSSAFTASACPQLKGYFECPGGSRGLDPIFIRQDQVGGITIYKILEGETVTESPANGLEYFLNDSKTFTRLKHYCSNNAFYIQRKIIRLGVAPSILVDLEESFRLNENSNLVRNINGFVVNKNQKFDININNLECIRKF